MKKILYVYKWATMGGVERVLLNRASAFKEHNVAISQHVYFYHDSGGKALLQKYIDQYNLEGYLKIVDSFDVEIYDLIHPIDTPEIFSSVKKEYYHKIVFECHTAYQENRGFIKKLPMEIKAIAVPSVKFKKEILPEVPSPLQKKIYVLNNFVMKAEVNKENYLNRTYNKKIIAYIGRVDKLKNVEEVIEIFVGLQKKQGDDFLLLVAGPLTPEVDLMKIIKVKGLSDRFLYFPSVPFSNVPLLLNLIKKNKGIVVSASKGESFGLAVAEAIIYDIPVVASDVHSHLVEADETFLYTLGNINEAIEKIGFILGNEKYVIEKLKQHKEYLSERQFIKDWEVLG